MTRILAIEGGRDIPPWLVDELRSHHCDWRGRCKRRPYREVFPFRVKPPHERDPRFPCDMYEFSDWSHLCFWHFQYARIWYRLAFMVGHTDRLLGYGYPETEGEYITRRLEEERDDQDTID